ncbi:hypothetical protein [Arthrobacter sp. CP30]
MSVTPANASVLALHHYGHRAGTAAAVIGALQSGVAGLLSPFVGLLGGDQVAMVCVMLAAAALTLLVLATGTEKREAEQVQAQGPDQRS